MHFFLPYKSYAKAESIKGKESTALHNLITGATWLFDMRCGQKTPEGCPRSYDQADLLYHNVKNSLELREGINNFL